MRTTAQERREAQQRAEGGEQDVFKDETTRTHRRTCVEKKRDAAGGLCC